MTQPGLANVDPGGGHHLRCAWPMEPATCWVLDEVMPLEINVLMYSKRTVLPLATLAQVMAPVADDVRVTARQPCSPAGTRAVGPGYFRGDSRGPAIASAAGLDRRGRPWQVRPVRTLPSCLACLVGLIQPTACRSTRYDSPPNARSETDLLTEEHWEYREQLPSWGPQGDDGRFDTFHLRILGSRAELEIRYSGGIPRSNQPLYVGKPGPDRDTLLLHAQGDHDDRISCRRQHVQVHPAGAKLTLACGQPSPAIWSHPEFPVDAWVCSGAAKWIPRFAPLMFARAPGIERIQGSCMSGDHGQSYNGLRLVR